MKRMTDKSYYTYSAYTALTSEICVKCPRCNRLGVVTADEDYAYFKCANCGRTEVKDCKTYHYDVHNHCENCGLYYKVDITKKSKQQFHMLRVACSFCGHKMLSEVYKTARAFYYYEKIQNSHEPFFGYELWFLSYFKNKPVWAINREHLIYLIDYLSADLREKPAGLKTMKTQSDQLPAFMKAAKNRERIVKLLKNLQDK